MRREGLEKLTPQQLHVSYVLCANHFEDTQFMNPSAVKKSLIHNALPTLFEIPNPPKTVTPSRPPPKQRKLTSTHASTISSLSDATPSTSNPTQTLPDTPTKTKLKKKVAALQKTVTRKNEKIKRILVDKNIEEDRKYQYLHQHLSQFVSGNALEFIMTQIKLSGKTKHSYRWSPKNKSLAMSIFHASPKAYRILRKIFRLPHTVTLKRAMNKLEIEPEFSSNILQALKLKIDSMPQRDRACIIIFDEISLKEHVVFNAKKDRVEGFEDFGFLGRSKYISNHACVFMARGLFSKWKQPFGFFFTSGTIRANILKELLFQGIDKLKEIGLNVKACVCDQGSNNTSLMRSLGVTVQSPYFQFDDQPVFVIYDPPHLLKNIRNNLKKHGFRVGDNTTSWTYIEKFYEQDSKLPIRMAPRLTKGHLELKPFKALRVRLAAQVLSRSVAAGITTMVALKALPAEAQHTANFIQRIDSMFNCLNSYTIKSSKPYQGAITPTSNHKSFLKDCLEWLKSVHSLSACSKVLPCLEGWQISIQSTLSLFDALSEEYNISFFLTSRLNQDCLENLFSSIRGKGGHRDNPDIVQFQSALKQIMVDLVLVSNEGKNCEDDVDSFLFNLNNDNVSVSAFQPSSQISSCDPEDILIEVESLPQQLFVQEENVLAYIAGYILHRLSPSLSCLQCASNLVSYDRDGPQYLFINNKQYGECSQGLKYPSESLISICQCCESIYNRDCEKQLHTCKIKQNLVRNMLQAALQLTESGNIPPCQCNTLTRVIKLYTNIRLHHSLRLNNRHYTQSKRQNRKILKLSHI